MCHTLAICNAFTKKERDELVFLAQSTTKDYIRTEKDFNPPLRHYVHKSLNNNISPNTVKAFHNKKYNKKTVKNASHKDCYTSYVVYNTNFSQEGEQ